MFSLNSTLDDISYYGEEPSDIKIQTVDVPKHEDVPDAPKPDDVPDVADHSLLPVPQGASIDNTPETRPIEYMSVDHGDVTQTSPGMFVCKECNRVFDQIHKLKSAATHRDRITFEKPLTLRLPAIT